MENPAIIAAWAAAIAAFFGPILSIVLAHYMASRENKRIEAAKLFRSIIAHSHSYRRGLTKMLAAQNTELAAFQSRTNANLNPNFHSQERRDEADENYRKAVGMRNRAVFEWQDLEADLQADILAIELLFCSQGKQLVETILQLLDVHNNNSTDEDIELRATELMQEITVEIKPLHNSLHRDDAA